MFRIEISGSPGALKNLRWGTYRCAAQLLCRQTSAGVTGCEVAPGQEELLRSLFYGSW